MTFINPRKVISQAAVGIGSTVVDFGFGKGEFLSFLAREIGEDGKLYAVDIQEDIVNRIKNEFTEKGILNTEFLTADLEEEKSTKLAEQSVDFILISSLFFQIENRNNVIKEAVRILKPGGRILFIDWRDSFAGIGPDKNLIFSEEDAILFFKKYPLSLERRIDSGIYHYALIYRKD